MSAPKSGNLTFLLTPILTYAAEPQIILSFVIEYVKYMLGKISV